MKKTMQEIICKTSGKKFKGIVCYAVVILCSSVFSAAGKGGSAEGEFVLHDGWEFSRDQKEWKGVRVPHDWAIAGPFDPKIDHGSGMLPWKGVGYYRRTIELPSDAAGKFVALRFGGVMARPEVFLNGEKVGSWDYGYMSFEVDVSAKLKFGEKNELLVKVDTTKHYSRWYPGAGIYRDVKLVVEDAEDRAIWGSVKITTPEITPERAKVRVEYLTPVSGNPIVNEFEVERPVLWDVANPKLYETTICGKKYRYGIRTAKFTANDGFILNGRRVQLKGVNLHSDLGPLGMAFDKGAMRRQLELMKDMGVNALRTSHNAPAEEVLDLCDEMGILVWNECFDKWDGTAGIAEGDTLEEYVSRNLKQFVRRDRNHPCVVCWSIGNEISPRREDYPAGVYEERCKLFREVVLSEDTTRPVGIGCCHTESAGRGDYASMDLTGWNYTARYMPMREKYPEKPIVYSESASAFSSWGYFPNVPTATPTNYDPNTVVDIDSYDRCSAWWSDIPDMEFARMEQDRFVAGEFVWTGIDYLGEPSPNPNLCRSSFFGICDLCAMPKDRYWLYRSYWNDRKDTVHLLPHWNWDGREGEKVTVVCYTSGDEAELFVNGESAGRRKKVKDAGAVVGKDDPNYYKVTERYRLTWEVPYEPGEIKVIAFRNGRPIGEDFRKTAHKAAAVKLTPEQAELADGELGFVKVEIEDDDGTVLPLAKDRVNFKLEGPGEIVAVGNGSHNGLDSFAETSSHPLYYGRALVIVRRTGGSGLPLKLTASAPSVRSATVTLGATPATPYEVQAPGSAKLVFDTSNAPDLRKWTEEKFAPTMCEWVVKLTDIMASDGWEPPKDILFKFVVEPLQWDTNAPAWASSGDRKVSLRVDWFRKNLDGEALGCTIHELTHIMQAYWSEGQNKDNCPGWAVEGYADYIRWVLFEPEADGCGFVRNDIKKYHYNDSYRVTAHFFGFVESRYPGTMKKLNAAMRDHTFDNGKFWKETTGKSAEELEADWKAKLV